ncbi:hypothetical protein PCS_03295 [Desulfocurvibacter africanus PCS]|uniref:DUF116 domain-containing protein n=1 Tax=Desulfocurvibacter africanus PCS TaxID=1262666 RepID=M5PNQ4_DESAF|nr:DUF116 domain-containing protein [Desulfocurvibacter africanus]EMG35812.1 hypothetical protein PCS_03295 [Desulfocurvibacter africanus PCS]
MQQKKPLDPLRMPEMPSDDEIQARKRLFVGLILGASGLVCLFFVLLWIVPFVGLNAIHPYAPWIWGLVVSALVSVVLWASLGLVLNITTGRSFPFFKRQRGMTVKLFLPLMTLLGRALGISKERIRNSFIKVNNELVRSEAKTYAPQEVLLLMPHCLQNSRCDHRLTYDIDNCVRCGKCPIKGLLELRDKYGVHLAIATGGTIARRIVVQKRPRLIVAVACERDLSSGIQDTFPLPVYGVLNLRPHGPCLDTLVPFPQLEQALRRFLDPAQLAEIDAAAQSQSAKPDKPSNRSRLAKSDKPSRPLDASSGQTDKTDKTDEHTAPTSA